MGLKQVLSLDIDKCSLESIAHEVYLEFFEGIEFGPDSLPESMDTDEQREKLNEYQNLIKIIDENFFEIEETIKTIYFSFVSFFPGFEAPYLLLRKYLAHKNENKEAVDLHSITRIVSSVVLSPTLTYSGSLKYMHPKLPNVAIKYIGKKIDENIPLINYGKNRVRYGASTLYDNSRSLIYKGGIFAIGLVEGVFNLFSKNSKKS